MIIKNTIYKIVKGDLFRIDTNNIREHLMGQKI